MSQIEKRHGWGRVSSYLAGLTTSLVMLPTALLLNEYDNLTSDCSENLNL